MATLVAVLLAACGGAPQTSAQGSAFLPSPKEPVRLPTGALLDPAGPMATVGAMPLAMTVAPERQLAVMLLSGFGVQGLQVLDRASGRVVQTFPQPSAFLGLAFTTDGQRLYTSGGNQDVVYRYQWSQGEANFLDSIVLAVKAPDRNGTRYPAGLAVSRDGRVLYVAENLADSLAVVDTKEKKVVARFPTERYPYAVLLAPDGTVYVSSWGGNTVSVFSADRTGMLTPAARIKVGRHPSAMVLSFDASRLYVASGSTDRVSVVDTRTREVIAELHGPPGNGPSLGSTPNALALTEDGTRLLVAEADNNAVAVFNLSSKTANILAATGDDKLAGRFPTGWYPTALAVDGDFVLVANGKGRGTGPNTDGPSPVKNVRRENPKAYTLGQLTGTVMQVPFARLAGERLATMTSRVAKANGWDAPGKTPATYPPFEHVIYIIKENRTYDQVLGDLGQGDGDPSLVFFPRESSPNHHALAERFGVFDRFFVNAEVSPDGHNWSTAAYASDYLEKTVPSNYSGRGRPYDYEGTNRGFGAESIPDDDANEPANGYLWNLAQRAGITFRNYGEFVSHIPASGGQPAHWIGNKPFLAANTSPTYPGWDLAIRDQVRADAWLAEFNGFVRSGQMPKLQLLRLPNDHTSGTTPNRPTPRAYMADNDLALGRIIDALSHSSFWRNTVVFVVEDDAQNGADHVDSHRSPFLVISAYNRPGVQHRWTNTTDVIATMAEVLKLGSLTQFDFYGRPLRDVFSPAADAAPYAALTPAASLDEMNARGAPGSGESSRLDWSEEDRANEDVLNHVLWRAIKGEAVPYPGATRMSPLEWKRAR